MEEQESGSSTRTDILCKLPEKTIITPLLLVKLLVEIKKPHGNEDKNDWLDFFGTS